MSDETKHDWAELRRLAEAGIPFQPNVVLALLARAEAAEAERDELAQALTDATAACDRIAQQRDAALKDGFLAGHKAARAERDAARAEAARLREALTAAEKVMRRVQDWGNARDTELADLAYEQVRAALAAKEPGHE